MKLSTFCVLGAASVFCWVSSGVCQDDLDPCNCGIGEVRTGAGSTPDGPCKMESTCVTDGVLCDYNWRREITLEGGITIQLHYEDWVYQMGTWGPWVEVCEEEQEERSGEAFFQPYDYGSESIRPLGLPGGR